MDLAQEVEKRLKAAFVNAEIVVDFADGMHMAVEIQAVEFAGKGLIDQHKMVYAAVQDLIDQGYLHALKIKTIIKKA